LLSGEHNTLIKIADFGLARAFSIPIKPYTKDVVTLYYRSPELLLKMNEYATPVDIWSCGCIFAELAMRRPLFQGQNEMLQTDEIFRIMGTPNEGVWSGVSENQIFKSRKWEQYPRQHFRDFIKSESISDSGLDLLQKMLEYEPSRRITAR
jgi:serine/threonine protein kinase